MSGFGALWAQMAIALVVAGAVYAGLKRFEGDNLSPDKRDALSKWLKGLTVDTWTRQYGVFFDTLFGEDHFSWRCFRRSAYASLISVFLLYITFGPVLGLMQTRVDDDLSIVQLVLLGVVINIIPDYLSLLETRWVIRYLERSQGFVIQLPVMLIDLVVTAIIIWVGIGLFQWARGEDPVSLVEMVAAYSVFSVFFFSTFLTSAWAWVFALSTWMVRLFVQGQVRDYLNIDKKPLTQVGLFAAVTVFFGALAGIQFAADSTETEVSDFDHFLCDTFSAEVCPHLIRIAPDEEKQVFVKKACNAGVSEQCVAAVLDYFDGEEIGAIAAWREQCSQGDADACFSLGYVYDQGEGVERDERVASALYREACEASNAGACVLVGRMYRRGRGVGKDVFQAVEFANRACDMGSMPGCVDLGAMYEEGFGGHESSIRADALYRLACTSGFALGCHNLEVMYQKGRGVIQSDAQAVLLYQRACDDGHANACANLGLMYEYGRGVPKNAERAKALFRQACDADETAGCVNLNSIYVEALGFVKDKSEAVAHYRRSCGAGDPEGCFALSVMFEDNQTVTQDDARAEMLYRRACARGWAAGCSNLGLMYEYGRGVVKNDQRAVDRYRQACNAGSTIACDFAEQLTQ